MSEPDPPYPYDPINETTAALGLALGQWQEVEGELFTLYQALAGEAVMPNPTTTIWNAVISTHTKIKIVDALVQFTIKDAHLLAQWVTVLNAVKRQKKTRDKLAHWRIVPHLQDGKWSVFLAQPFPHPKSFTKGYGEPHTGALDAASLREQAKHFNRLSQDIREFITAYLQLTWHGKSKPKS